MKRRYNMPFGAQFREDGSVRFRLWAPAARQVELCIAKSPTRLPLERREDGWFELVTDAAATGAQYKFRINGAQEVPDPASRFQSEDVHGPSQVVDPHAFDWRDDTWHGRPWEEAVTYELHVGAFAPPGNFSAVRQRLDYLADLGVTALELMPVADFPGQRNWGYDGVFTFAPDSTYGRPEDLKQLVDSAHKRGLMVFLDVVYNHFGPEGNYLRSYAPQFFTDRHCTPWGDGINFDGPESKMVRDFFIHNALYWLTEYHFDGLRLDAVHAIIDDSTPDILTELAAAVRNSMAPGRHIHLILENDRNQSRYLKRADCQPKAYTAQWNDDVHHALHVLVTDERDGYYSDYSACPIEQLGRCLVEGFAYQGEPSRYRKGEARGESTKGLPPSAFVSFLQNHDQVGNRAFGERITEVADARAVRAAAAIFLLAPFPPLLFMGEEFAAATPFLFFCNFEKDLAAAVTAGRRNEFAHFAPFDEPSAREKITDPSDANTFAASKLDWSELDHPIHREWLRFYQELLKIRLDHIVPRLSTGCPVSSDYQVNGDRGLYAQWKFPDRSALTLMANLGADSLSVPAALGSQILFASESIGAGAEELPPWSVFWSMEL